MLNIFNLYEHVMPESKKTLSTNITRLLSTQKGVSRLELSKRIGVADGTLGRIKYGSGNPNIETLNAIATFFKLESWQLLIKNLDPKYPPILQKTDDESGGSNLNSDEVELLNVFRSLGEPERTYLLYQAQTYAKSKES